MINNLPVLAIGLLLTAGAAAEAVAVDDALVARLEAATTVGEEQATMREIQRRLESGPLPTLAADRLVQVLLSRESLAEPQAISILRALGAVQPYSEAVIVAMAGGLAGSIVHNWTGTELIASALREYQTARRLPESAFDALRSALGHRAVLNRSAAITVLAATPEADPRHAQAMAAIVAALTRNDHEHTRSTAIKALGQMAGGRALPDFAIAALDAAASDDPYMTVRMDALEVLVAQPPDPQRRQRLSQTLTRELVAPTPELWARSRGLDAHAGLESRAVDLLTRWFEGSYPPHVIEALIALTRKYDPEPSLVRLEQAQAAGALTDEHLRRLDEIARTHPQPRYRAAIYRLTSLALEPPALPQVLRAFEEGDDGTARIQAGYAVARLHTGQAVPPRVADVAERVMLGAESAELQAIAARLVAAGEEDFALREARLLRGLAQHPHEPGVQQALMDLYGPDRLDDLVARFGADTSVSNSFRTAAIARLGDAAAPERTLSVEATQALERAAWNSSDYVLIGTIARTLRAWNAGQPLVIHFKTRENQTGALLVISLLCVALDLGAGVVGLVALAILPLRARPSLTRRAVLVLAWLALSAGMLLAMAWGAIGYLGHNRAPLPIETLALNAPLYVATLVYVVLARILFRRAKRSATR